MKQIIIATAIALAFPAISNAVESVQSLAAGSPSPQEQYRAVCNGTSDLPDAIPLGVIWCGPIVEPIALNLTPKQQVIYDHWVLNGFLHSKHFFAAARENTSRHCGHLFPAALPKRPPLSDTALQNEQQLAGFAAESANKYRRELIATLNVSQARTMLLNGDVAWIDPYFDYSRDVAACSK